MRPWFGQGVFVANATQAFDDKGQLVDEKLRGLLTTYMTGFSAFVDSSPRSRST
jgi:hypothetical protein